MYFSHVHFSHVHFLHQKFEKCILLGMMKLYYFTVTQTMCDLINHRAKVWNLCDCKQMH
jgi:hypothetical protein